MNSIAKYIPHITIAVVTVNAGVVSGMIAYAAWLGLRHIVSLNS